MTDRDSIRGHAWTGRCEIGKNMMQPHILYVQMFSLAYEVQKLSSWILLIHVARLKVKGKSITHQAHLQCQYCFLVSFPPKPRRIITILHIIIKRLTLRQNTVMVTFSLNSAESTATIWLWISWALNAVPGWKRYKIKIDCTLRKCVRSKKGNSKNVRKSFSLVFCYLLSCVILHKRDIYKSVTSLFFSFCWLQNYATLTRYRLKWKMGPLCIKMRRPIIAWGPEKTDQ